LSKRQDFKKGLKIDYVMIPLRALKNMGLTGFDSKMKVLVSMPSNEVIARKTVISTL